MLDQVEPSWLTRDGRRLYARTDVEQPIQDLSKVLLEVSVAKPFLSNCGSLDLLFADFSMILRILFPIFSQQKKRERKTTRRTRENDAGITRPSDFKKKVGHTGAGTTVLPDKIVLRSHARPKDDVEARKGKLCLEIQSIPLFHRSSLCWNERLSFAGPAKYIIDPLPATSTGSLDSRGIGLHVTGNVNKASVVDAENRAAQSKRERNATREPDERPVGKLQDERKLAAFFAFFCLSVLHTLLLAIDRTWSLFMMQTGQKYC